MTLLQFFNWFNLTDILGLLAGIQSGHRTPADQELSEFFLNYPGAVLEAHKWHCQLKETASKHSLGLSCRRNRLRENVPADTLTLSHACNRLSKPSLVALLLSTGSAISGRKIETGQTMRIFPFLHRASARFCACAELLWHLTMHCLQCGFQKGLPAEQALPKGKLNQRRKAHQSCLRCATDDRRQ